MWKQLGRSSFFLRRKERSVLILIDYPVQEGKVDAAGEGAGSRAEEMFQSRQQGLGSRAHGEELASGRREAGPKGADVDAWDRRVEVRDHGNPLWVDSASEPAGRATAAEGEHE